MRRGGSGTGNEIAGRYVAFGARSRAVFHVYMTFKNFILCPTNLTLCPKNFINDVTDK